MRSFKLKDLTCYIFDLGMAKFNSKESCCFFYKYVNTLKYAMPEAFLETEGVVQDLVYCLSHSQ